MPYPYATIKLVHHKPSAQTCPKCNSLDALILVSEEQSSENSAVTKCRKLASDTCMHCILLLQTVDSV